MEPWFILRVIGNIFGIIKKKKELIDRSNEIDYKSTLGLHLGLIEEFSKVKSDAKADLENHGMFDMRKYEAINITKKQLISSIVSPDSGFYILGRYSELIKDYTENKKKPHSTETDKERIYIENNLILTYAEHLLDVKKYIVHYPEDEKNLLLGYLEELKQEIEKNNKKGGN